MHCAYTAYRHNPESTTDEKNENREEEEAEEKKKFIFYNIAGKLTVFPHENRA